MRQCPPSLSCEVEKLRLISPVSKSQLPPLKPQDHTVVESASTVKLSSSVGFWASSLSGGAEISSTRYTVTGVSAKDMSFSSAAAM